MFIQTEATPNPDAVKFFAESSIAPSPIHFSNVSEAKGTILVMNLFKIDGVGSVFFGADFITITKQSEQKWEILQPYIISAIMDHVTSGMHVLEGYKPYNEDVATNFSDIEKQIMEIIETMVRPSVAMDGGDIIYKSFEEGVVYLELKGSCAGCPSSEITLKNGVETMLQYYIPEIVRVEAI